MKYRAIAGLLMSVITSVASAQNAQTDTNGNRSDASKMPQFEVVSVSEVRGSDTGRRQESNWTHDGYVAENMPLKRLVCFAYGIPWDRVNGGPSWIEKTGFDIQAKVGEADIAALNSLSQRQRNELLKPLLAQRFHVQVHTTTTVVPVYELVIAKDGPKIKASAVGENGTVDPSNARMLVSTTQIDGHGMKISNLANALHSNLERPVLDKTGLSGAYDFNLKWTPPKAQTPETAELPNADPDIFTALKEQLGLELKTSKAPIDTLVIDSAELPTAN